MIWPAAAALAAGARDGEEPLLVAQLAAAVARRARRRARCPSPRRCPGRSRTPPRAGSGSSSRCRAPTRRTRSRGRSAGPRRAAGRRAGGRRRTGRRSRRCRRARRGCRSKPTKTDGSNPPAPRAGRADAGVAEAVVHAPLLRVGEHRVGLGRFLELLLGLLVAGIAVGVVLERELAVGALDLLLGGRPRDAEHLVVVALAHALATFTIAGRSRRSPSL